VAVKEAAKEVAPPVVVQKASKEAAPPVAVKEAAPPVVVQKASKEAAPPVAVKEAAPPVVVQKAAKEAVQNDVQVAIEMVNNLNIQPDLADNKNQPNPLELIRSALEQINYALQLLNEVKKTSSPEIQQKSDSESILLKAPVVPQPILEEAPVVAQPIPAPAQLVNIDYISDVDVDVEVQNEKEEERKEENEEKRFKIVMPKKSKNKKAVATQPVKEITKKDEFPSLGSSFTPVKKTGFWGGEAKKSLEIAKSIAHIPSPPPTFSPSPSLKKSNKLVRYGRSLDDQSDEECFDRSEEFYVRKRYGEEDDD
jgi:hypothetical protein